MTGGAQLDLLDPMNADEKRAAGDAGAAEGMERARAHAEAVVPSWGETAMNYLRAYMLAVDKADVISPDVREWARQRGLAEPPHQRAWGAVFSKAARHGLIRFHGFMVYGDAEMHSQSIRVWRRV